MCGVFGQIATSRSLNNDEIDLVGKLISHRGPDDVGWTHFEGGFLANRRLSIIDIENGKQPFLSDDGRYALVQNGVIYNYKELSKRLISRGVKLKTDSDTEVLMHYFIEFGVTGLADLNGMFCFAIRDNVEKKVVIVRDRVGIKPCFYSSNKNGFIFSSEIRIISKIMNKNKISSKSLYNLFSLGYLPPPFTIFDGINQLKPGHYMEVDDFGEFKETPWWEFPTETVKNSMQRLETINHVDKLVENAVKIRTVADVPVGSFLSGGLDSTWISLHLKKFTTEELKTFTLTFPRTSFDESAWALEVSNKIETCYLERKVEPSDLKKWEEFVYFCEQPHCDISFIPTFLVSELAAKHVKVVLTGDGGDEVFGGYNRYKDFFKLEDDVSNEQLVKLHLKQNRIYQKENIQNLDIFTENEVNQFEKTLEEYYVSLLDKYSKQDAFNRALLIDMQTLLPGNNLVKPDRMGMAHSIEARVPLLDPNILTFMFSLHGREKANLQETRTLQKEILKKYFSEKFVDRKKHMLTVPVTDWQENQEDSFVVDLEAKGLILGKIKTGLIEKFKKEQIEDPHKNLKILRLLNSIKLFQNQIL